MSNDIIEAEFTEEGELLPDVIRTDIDVEFDYTRQNLVHILETSKNVLEKTAKLAVDSETPRMVEVYSTLIKNLVEINKSLLDLREKKMKIKGELIDTETKPRTRQIINNNAIFVGSTEELLQSFKDKKI